MISFELHLKKWHEKTQKPLWFPGFPNRYLFRFAMLVAEAGLDMHFAGGKNQGSNQCLHWLQELSTGQFLCYGFESDLNLRPVAVPYIFGGGQSRLENIDRCHSLASLPLPPAAVGSLPSGNPEGDCILLHNQRKHHPAGWCFLWHVAPKKISRLKLI